MRSLHTATRELLLLVKTGGKTRAAMRTYHSQLVNKCFKAKSQPPPQPSVWFCVYEITRIGKFIETESYTFARWRWNWRGVTPDGYEVSFGGNRNVLKSIRVMITQLCELMFQTVEPCPLNRYIV